MALDYGQFCPVAKAAELLGEKWTLLIVRELVCGSTRFSELKRGMPRISPTLLTRRLNELCDAGLVMRKRRPGGRRSHEYFLTEAGRELESVVEALGVWGMRWARQTMSDAELDIEVLMWDVRRNIDTSCFAGPQTVLGFEFTDAEEYAYWWVIVSDTDVDLCVDDPGVDVDLWFRADARTLVEVWLGDTTLDAARRTGRLELLGQRALVKTAPQWFTLSNFAGVPRAGAP